MGKRSNDASGARSRGYVFRDYKRYFRGLFHSLHYHHFADARKMLPHRKRAIWCAKPRTSSMERGASEMEPFLDTEANRLQLAVKHHPEKRPTTVKSRSDPHDGGSSPSWSSQKTKGLNRDFSHEQVEEYIDILETFNVNKDLFVKFFKDPHVAVSNKSYAAHTPDRLTKSGSFPLQRSSSVRKQGPATLEQKLMESWSYPRRQGIFLTLKPKPEDDAVSRLIKDTPGELVKHGWFNDKVMAYLKHIKQRIQQGLVSRKKPKRGVTDQSPGKDEPRLLNNSMDRYSQLFSDSLPKELNFHSKSLKLNSYDKDGTSRHNLKFFRRNSSLSDIESFGLFLNELSRESFSSETLSRKSVDNITGSLQETTATKKPVDKNINLQISADRTDTGETVKGVDETFPEALSEGESRDSSGFPGGNKDAKTSPRSAQQEGRMLTELAPASCSPDSIPAGAITLGSQPRGGEELMIEVGQQRELSAYKDIETLYLRYGVKEGEASLFGYVRDVLELSGVLDDKDNGKWNWNCQLLNPSVLKELESRWQLNLSGTDCSILIDLIDEALMETCERFFIRFPHAFSLTRGVLSEVWSRTSWHLRCGKKRDQTLDDLVGRDLGRGDGWMSLQGESQSLGLELEDWILDDLLDELIE